MSGLSVHLEQGMISKEKEKNIKVSKVPKEIKKEGEGSIFMEPQTPGSVFIIVRILQKYLYFKYI